MNTTSPTRTYTLEIVSIVTMAFLGIIYWQSVTMTPNIDKALLDVAENSHYIGCGRVTLAFDYCRELSKQYRKDMAKAIGLKDQ